MRTEPSESGFQALAGAERIGPVREAQIHMDDFRVPVPVHLAARRAVHEQFAALWTVAQHEAVHVGGRTHGMQGSKGTATHLNRLLGKTPSIASVVVLGAVIHSPVEPMGTKRAQRPGRKGLKPFRPHQPRPYCAAALTELDRQHLSPPRRDTSLQVDRVAPAGA